MPLPKPRHKEKESDFVNRCMSEIGNDKTFKDSKQRVAVCYTQFKEAKASCSGVVDDGTGDEMLLFSDSATFIGMKRSELKDSDFLFPEKRFLPIVMPNDVTDAIDKYSHLGGDVSYEVFIKKLYEKCKSKGEKFIDLVPKEIKEKYNLS